jgi:Holliday junction resolvase
MSASEREKGARGEREIVQIFHRYGWGFAERTSNGREQKGKNDIANGPKGCAFEVKRVQKLSVPKALDQLARDSDPADIPILIHRPNRHEWMATMPLEELLPLLALREFG